MRSVISLGREWWLVLRSAVTGWLADRAPSMGAAIAYYTVFSLGPVLILIIAMAGLVYGKQAAEGALFDEIAALVGQESAGAVHALLRGASSKSSGVVASIVGMGALLLAATGVFGELQGAFNVIWRAERRPKASGVRGVLMKRLRSLCLILIVTLLLMSSLALTAALVILHGYLTEAVPSLPSLLGPANVMLSVVMATILFALMFKILPDAIVEWGDVWLGAATTAVLFTFGKYLVGLYIGGSGVMSTYHAAGAIVLILVWIYYGAQILLFGAELARAHGERRKARRAESGQA